MDSDQLHERIGRKIRDLRNQNELTQQELADRTELTKGYISQLERGQVAPSVETLFDLIECLGTSPSEFFEDEEESVVFKADDFPEKTDDAGNSIEWLVPSAQKNQMEPLLVRLEPGQSLEKEKPHEGEEFGYVLSGRIRLHLGDQPYPVKAGESFYFHASRPHWIENAGGRPAHFLWVSTPPTF